MSTMCQALHHIMSDTLVFLPGTTQTMMASELFKYQISNTWPNKGIMGPSCGFLLHCSIPEGPGPSLLHPGKWMRIINIENSIWAGMWYFPLCPVIISPQGLTHHLQTQNLWDGPRQLWKADLGGCINTLALV